MTSPRTQLEARRAEAIAKISADLQTKMEQRAAAVLADIFAAMPKDPTIDELDAELRTAIHALRHIQARHNAMRPKDAPRMHLRPMGMLLQALTNQFHKDEEQVIFTVGK